MKILNAMWFTAMGNPNAMGIVIAETEGKEQAYIGRSRSFRNGESGEFEDAQWIAECDASFPLDAARVLMPEDTISFKQKLHLL
jgi:hypothetical protein